MLQSGRDERQVPCFVLGVVPIHRAPDGFSLHSACTWGLFVAGLSTALALACWPVSEGTFAFVFAPICVGSALVSGWMKQDMTGLVRLFACPLLLGFGMSLLSTLRLSGGQILPSVVHYYAAAI